MLATTLRVLLINVPHPSIGSSIADHLPPLGLLAIAGPLIDGGHEVKLIDGEIGPRDLSAMAERAVDFSPDAILFGHSGSTTAHPAIAGISRQLRNRLPQATIIYGGVFPTYHWREILAQQPQIDVIVRGEGEETCRRVIACLAAKEDLAEVPGIAWRQNGEIRVTPPAAMIQDLDSYRVGWELIEHRHQVLETRHVPPWRVFLWVKLVEATLQLRPAAIWRTMAHPDCRLRAAMRWYGRLGWWVWPTEVRNYLFREKRTADGPCVADFWGSPQHDEAEALVRSQSRQVN